MTDRKEDNMNPKELEQTNPKGLTRREFLRRAEAAALGTAAGLVLPGALTDKARADALFDSA